VQLRKILEKETVIKQRDLSDTISKTKIKDYIDTFEPSNKNIIARKAELLKLYHSFVKVLKVDHLSEIHPKTITKAKKLVIDVSSLIDNVDKRVTTSETNIKKLEGDIVDYRKLTSLANYVHKIGKSIFE